MPAVEFLRDWSAFKKGAVVTTLPDGMIPSLERRKIVRVVDGPPSQGDQGGGDLQKQLLAAGVKAKDAARTIELLRSVARDEGALPAIVTAFVQTVAAGKLVETGAKAFIDAGVPILDDLARAKNTTTGDVLKKVEAGKVTVHDVLAAIKKRAESATKTEGQQQS